MRNPRRERRTRRRMDLAAEFAAPLDRAHAGQKPGPVPLLERDAADPEPAEPKSPEGR
jgi:hypothetical protein